MINDYDTFCYFYLYFVFAGFLYKVLPLRAYYDWLWLMVVMGWRRIGGTRSERSDMKDGMAY